jgi:hypothetical protein
MATLPTIGVDDDLAAGEAAVAHGTAHHETTRGVDEVAGVTVDHSAGMVFLMTSLMTASRSSS